MAVQLVYIGNSLGVLALYLHVTRICIQADPGIKKGRTLGLSGASGRVSGAHIHYGVYRCQARIDQVAFHRLTALLPRNEKK